MTKKYLSLLCIVKNEEYLEEFIIHHRNLGIEYFYIYDNESTVPVKDRLNHYYYQKCCKIIECPGQVKQIYAYNHFLLHYGNETEWVLIIDGDEFLLPKKHDNLISFIKEYHEYSAVAVNWINFGSNYHEYKPHGYLIENYTLCETLPDGHVKSFSRPSETKKIYNPHFVILNDNIKYKGYCDPLKNKLVFNKELYSNSFKSIDIIQVNHYWGRSYAELEQKINRGRAMMGSKREMPPNYHEMYNMKEDKLIIEKFLPQIKKVYKAICTHPSMYKILNKDLKDKFGDNLEEYTKHLINNGLKENRYFRIEDLIPDFNLDNYRKNYQDLENLTCMQLIDHYVNYGSKEGRVYDRLI